MYKQAADQKQQDAQSQAGPAATETKESGGSDGAVDADFEVVDEEDNK
jgi:hypothetical protein